MDPNDRKQLQEALELSRENNRLLRKMWRATQWGHAIRALYWLIIIGIAVGSIYFLQPYLDTLRGVYGGLQDAQAQFSDFF